jgi:hypothetical protein
VQFLATLRDRIRQGEITSTVRRWQRPHVKVGGRYSLPPAKHGAGRQVFLVEFRYLARPKPPGGAGG